MLCLRYEFSQIKLRTQAESIENKEAPLASNRNFSLLDSAQNFRMNLSGMPARFVYCCWFFCHKAVVVLQVWICPPAIFDLIYHINACSLISASDASAVLFPVSPCGFCRIYYTYAPSQTVTGDMFELSPTLLQLLWYFLHCSAPCASGSTRFFVISG